MGNKKIIEAIKQKAKDKKTQRIAFLILLTIVFLSACTFATVSSVDKNKGDDVVERDPDRLYLLADGKVEFQVVYTAKQGSMTLNAARQLVSELRDAGYDVPDPISDTVKESVADCEILIGANIVNRGDECSVSDKILGPDGQLIKVVGNKLVIAGGLGKMTKSAVESFISSELKDEEGKIKSECSIPRNYLYEKYTEYAVESISVNGIDLREFTLVFDIPLMSGYDITMYQEFQQILYNKTGYWLEKGSIENQSGYDNVLLVRCSKEVESGDFRVKVEGNDLIVECAHPNVFNSLFEEFIDAYFYDASGKVVFNSNFSYTKEAGTVYYEDFGAKGDGETDDFKAFLEAHEFANAGGQTVKSRLGKDGVFYIGNDFTCRIPVKTSIDFNGATVIVDDTVATAHNNRDGLFYLVSDTTERSLNSTYIRGLCGGDLPEIHKGDTSIPWLVGEITETSLIAIVNDHKDFIRHGANQNSGSSRLDMVIIYPDGSISEDTPIAWDFVAGTQTKYDGTVKEYNSLTRIKVYGIDDDPITIENVNYFNICCQTVEATNFQNKYSSYKRGFEIRRSNVTFRNIEHRMLNEPDFNYAEFGTYGDLSASYPYYGFLFMNEVCNILVEDCVLTGHTTYYEDKPATDSTGGVKPNPVAMGSYDFVINNSCNITFKNVSQVQYNEDPTSIGDSRYWGIMCSNGSKNMSFYGCHMNRFDAHRGFWNATLIDTVIGHSFNVIGGGYLYVENVTKTTGTNFINSRSDYGSTFDGDVTLVNCTFLAEKAFNSSREGVYTADVNSSVTVYYNNFSHNASTEGIGSYWNWDFGYECKMPSTITLDNFKSHAKKTYLFKAIPNNVFMTEAEGGIKNTYKITEKVIFKNMDKIAMCSSTKAQYSITNSIPYEVIKTDSNNDED